jgi:hypothetical protein
MDNETKKIILNGKELTEQEFLIEKDKLSQKKGVQLIQESGNVYTTRLHD